MKTPARHDNRTGGPGPKGRGRSGFTLIELLTVVAIIGLLVGMVVPTIQSVLEALYAARTLARIDNLANGAKMYKIEGTGNKYFPAQQYAKAILVDGTSIGAAGGGGDTGKAKAGTYKNAGGAFLARCLFAKPDPNSTGATALPDLFPVGNWAVLDTDMLDPPEAVGSDVGRDTPKAYSVLDCSSHPLAILYFVSRLESLGKAMQYMIDDNKVYIPDNTYLGTRDVSGTATPMDIQWFASIGDPTTATTVRMDGQFFIIAAGKATSTGSRKYFDSGTGLSNVPR
jgi:prepilin-type N-terminal cleavage/methylation domain-containing protein